jgi:hypothetical protein
LLPGSAVGRSPGSPIARRLCGLSVRHSSEPLAAGDLAAGRAILPAALGAWLGWQGLRLPPLS